ncbi:MAG TPA: hypothetical protein VK809_10840 [Bacteroidia bacterium]|jgi:hypothetical protein|nr:hypothetical protein [Bacteroidia bacterium]
MFIPSAIGSKVILYTYTDGHGCSDTASYDVSVSVCTGVNAVNFSIGYQAYLNPT